MPITFHAEEISLPEFNTTLIKEWINKVIGSEKKIPGEINYIFSSDEYLLKINKEYLNHDYFTDIISFDYCENNIISGDIFISVERVKENAITYQVAFQKELFRVIIHGILHLTGNNDSTDAEKEKMRNLEEHYLNLLGTI